MYNILCVDDNLANLLVLESLFEDNKSYNIIKANSGYEALEILLTQPIDLILLDVMMPEIDGFETAKLIKQNKTTTKIPIIFLTAKRDDVTIDNAFKYGVDYLTKPFDQHELFSRVKSQLKIAKLDRKIEEQLIFDQSIIDSQPNIIFVHDKDKLTNVNKSFLEFFNVNSIKDFYKHHDNVAELFMEYENYFSLSILNSNKPWTTHIATKTNTQYNVLILNTKTFEPETFIIDVNPIPNSQKYVVTLTNITDITIKSKQFEIKATYDNLTKIYNRSRFNELLTEHYNLFNRYNKPLCFAIFDIDFFKKVNDTYGHIVGDEILIKFSNTINESVRITDIFARWGGEEFTLLMPETKIKDGYTVCDNLRKLIENTDFKTVGEKTCSIGVTQFKKGDTIDTVLIRADEALYEAKETGRNKVCIR